MKKVFSLLLVAGMAAMISCGPSAEEKAAQQKLLHLRPLLPLKRLLQIP